MNPQNFESPAEPRPRRRPSGERNQPLPAPIHTLGNYRLVKKLGEGGMGAVFLAEDTFARRNVALKVLSQERAREPDFVARFQREAHAAGKLNHPNIVVAFAVDEERGIHFMAMEYCEGDPLDRLVERRGVLHPDEALDFIAQVALGLQHAHERGFVHRDIKPANIFICHGNEAKILDLGLSKNILDSNQSFNTQSGLVVGTAHYLSPEQASGDQDIDGRTDIYSLGATLYHLVTGRPPYDGPTAATVMVKHLNEPLPDPRSLRADLPAPVVRLIQNMMAKDRAQRYAGCAQLLEDIKLVRAGKMPQLAIKTAPIARAPRAAKRADALNFAPIAAAVVIAVAVLWIFSSARTKTESAPQRPETESRPLAPATAVTPSPISPAPAVPPPQAAPPPVAAPAPAVIVEQAQPSVPAKPPEAAVLARGATEHVRPDLDAWLKSLDGLPARDLLQRVQERLVELNPNFDGKLQPVIEDGAITKLSFSTERVDDLSPLRALTRLQALELSMPCAAWEADKEPAELRLDPLAGLALKSLNCCFTRVRNLEPLRGMPLEQLDVRSSCVQDVSPLKGMKLTALNLLDTRGIDLAPLSGMPLTSFWMPMACANYAAVANSPIKHLYLECRPSVNALFKAMPSIETINTIPAAEFWSSIVDGQPDPAAKAACDPARWKNAIGLLSRIDPARDPARPQAVSFTGTILNVNQTSVDIPYQPPDEYDYRIVFKRHSGVICQLAAFKGRPILLQMGLGDRRASLFFKSKADNPVSLTLPQGVRILEPDRQYSALLQVRNEGVRVYLDDRLLFQWQNCDDLTTPDSYKRHSPNILGFGASAGTAQFLSAELIEITGQGKPTR